MADYHAHPALPITSHTERPHNPQDYTAEDGERKGCGEQEGESVSWWKGKQKLNWEERQIIEKWGDFFDF